MRNYAIKRLLITIPVIVAIAILVFTLLYFTPGDPAIMILGDAASEEQLEEYRAFLGIDRPYIEQLGDYLYRLFIKWDLGDSWVYKTNISYEIANRLPRTFLISVYSILAGLLTGIPLGVLAAVHQNRLPDKIILFMSSIMHCVPGYVYAILLILLFSLTLGWLPAFGVGGIEYYILPCLSILIGSFTTICRQMRSSMLEVIRSDYVMAARAQGYSRRAVYYRHALPNALIPVVTMVGGQFATALSGTMILETIFSIPGMGLYIQGAIGMRDIPVITGCTVFMGIWYCLVMLAVDLVYAILDPRVREQYKEQGVFWRRRSNKDESDE